MTTQNTQRRFSHAFMQRLRTPLEVNTVVVLAALFLVLIHNSAFWAAVSQSIATDSPHRLAFMLVLGGILTTAYITVFGLLGLHRWVFKASLALLFLVAAAASYFMTHYSAVIDSGMVENAWQTDPAEAIELLNFSFFAYVLILGALPSALVLRWKTPKESVLTALFARIRLLTPTVGLLLVLIAAQLGNLTVWGRNHRELRMVLNPSYPLYALSKVINHRWAGEKQPLLAIALDARQTPSQRTRPFTLLMVVGETARADHFQLNGYSRPTNPLLSQRKNLVSFTDVTSCGSDTAHSVPCMFSQLGHEDASPSRAADQENVLDVLQRAGVKVLWRDNNSGCKGVCERVPHLQMDTHANGEPCPESGCFDEVLLEGLDQEIATNTGAQLIVLHQKGSHGPAYYRRYPKEFSHFEPACEQDDLRRCSLDEIANAYDNSLLYTDWLLDQSIALLSKHAVTMDTMLLYVSDHGESLGEDGIYLHGLPMAFAPAAQTHVPMLVWSSGDGDATDHCFGGACLASRKDLPLSHDVLFDSLLSIFQVDTMAYRPEFDIFAPRHSTELMLSHAQ